MMNHISIIDILNTEDYVSKEVNICGWVKTFRANRFIALNDGSSIKNCLLYTSPSPRDLRLSRMPSSA